ncbi:CaiB/BaiF CoA transferase family protein [Micromonospora sp. NBC_01412]|uniref:CaiB/BaiF CoA transferase family protein n=1 Tax=Micromonospora sp. NBC_01412 TaxID=2903590 RepID=UPI0032494127
MTHLHPHPQGPLVGVRVVELAALGPVPFAGMLLSDMGADVVRIDRAGLSVEQRARARNNVMNRGRRSVALDLKSSSGQAAAHRMMAQADVLMEGFRPGVAERLGLAPQQCLEANPRLVYGRMSGWGQAAPNRGEPGHDINFLAASGLLDTIGTEDSGPVPPLMYLGDFAGGGLTLALAIVSALVERATSGRGQVIDASILDGTAQLGIVVQGATARGTWHPQRGTNAFDTGAPYYNVYACRDGRHLAVGAVEPEFYANLLRVLGLTDISVEGQNDRSSWPALKLRIAELIRSRDLADWVAAFQGVEACVTPVLDIDEAMRDQRFHTPDAYVDYDGVRQSAPTPRFSRTPSGVHRPSPLPGEHSEQVLREYGFDDDAIGRLLDDRIEQ